MLADGTFWAIDNGLYAGAVAEWHANGIQRLYAGVNFDAGGAVVANTWYAIQHVFNGASSVISLNGSETSGDAGTQALSNYTIWIGGHQGLDFCDMVLTEWGFKNAAISDRTALNTNMRAAYRGF
jgi:hypothetical protein